MLYDRFCAIASNRRHDVALRDLATGRQWSFADLRVAAEAGAPDRSGIAYPRGNAPEFIFSLLRAWRSNQVACPLEADQAPPQIPACPRGYAHLKTTSATTGTMRLVAFTETQLAADADNIAATMGLRPDWPNLAAIPLAHSYGFSNLVLPLLLHGIPLVIAPSPLPEVIRRALSAAPGLTLAAVPALWRTWHEAGIIVPSIRLAVSAGAPLPVGLERTVFEASGVKIHNFYGSTECGGIAYDASDAPREDDACVGAPLANVEVSVNADGCLQVRGSSVGETYWPESTDSLGGGRFLTSDFGNVKRGLVYLRGRSSDQINVAGRKLSPETVESALAAHPLVRECLVFGAPSRDTQRTDIVVAVVAGNAEESQLKTFLQQKLPAWQIPREWRFVKSLSVNHRGKLSRAQWQRHYLASLDPHNR